MPSHKSRNMHRTTPANTLTGCRSNQIVVQQPTERGNTTCQPQLVQHSTNNNMTMRKAHIACHVKSHATCKAQPRQTNSPAARIKYIRPRADNKGKHNLSATAGTAQHQQQFCLAARTHCMPSHKSRKTQPRQTNSPAARPIK